MIVDTDVWSRAVLAMHQGDPRVASWRRLLLGRSVFIAAQTEAELRFWPLWRGWSAARSQLLFDALSKTPTLPVTPSVIQRYAELRASCRLSVIRCTRRSTPATPGWRRLHSPMVFR